MRIVLFFLIVNIKLMVAMKSYSNMHILHTKRMTETETTNYRQYDELIDKECRSLITTFQQNMATTTAQDNFFRDLYTIHINWVTVPAYIHRLIENDESITKDNVTAIKRYLIDLSSTLNTGSKPSAHFDNPK